MTLLQSVAEACDQTTPAEEDLTEWGVDAKARDVISEAGLGLLGDHDDLAGLAMEVGVILELCNPSAEVMIAVAVFQLPAEVEPCSNAHALAVAEVEMLDSVHVMAVECDRCKKALKVGEVGLLSNVHTTV